MQNKSTPETRSRKCLKDNRLWCGNVGNRGRRDCLSCTKKYTVDGSVSITTRVKQQPNGGGNFIGIIRLPKVWVGKKVEIRPVKETEEE
jgi:hypothetical protein